MLCGGAGDPHPGRHQGPQGHRHGGHPPPPQPRRGQHHRRLRLQDGIRGRNRHRRHEACLLHQGNRRLGQGAPCRCGHPGGHGQGPRGGGARHPGQGPVGHRYHPAHRLRRGPGGHRQGLRRQALTAPKAILLVYAIPLAQLRTSDAY
ncbi:hypothetical protein MTBUT4_130034 [Magnetospirillum sp. UT-4]|nr:hypothetical protein MTBUT4_130034 [Magnetospirillum sp. UT-4]